jgi:hypothetical protein
VLESSVEASCCKYAAKRGCWPIKIWGGVTGDPDRGFVLPGHLFWPVEFKKPKGRRSKRQIQRHLELERLGVHVMVIDNRAEFVWWLDTLLADVVDSGYAKA